MPSLLKLRHLLLSAVSMATGSVWADDPMAHAVPSYELGLTLHDELYEEFDTDGSKFMQESATMYGIKGSARRTVNAHDLVRFTAEYAVGEAEYVGSYQGGEYGDLREGGLSRKLFEITFAYERYQHAEPVLSGFSVKGGLGYRRLVDNLQESGAGGYKRTNERVYAIVGVAYGRPAGWRITPALDFKQSLWSRNLSEVYEDDLSVSHRQEGYGWEASLSLTPGTDKLPVVIRPFYRVWKMDDSNVVDGSYEPRNETREVGVDVSWQF